MRIEGFFDNFKKTNEVIDALKAAGFKTAFLDLKDERIGERNLITNLPGTETSPSLSNLVLESGNRGADVEQSPLAAANPMVSGMAGFEEIADYSHKVVVEANAKDVDRAKDIISKMGGELNSSSNE
ncbi:hypothetical protein [Clostridium formicaceticum]|uniref:Uncharacterized protein n=1 Tax=Clostridium formicaceticum TaxID=1497 RepID=A0AAC9RLG5_9CLOT|nr:hypothetical protein [Clostridium formicaceticum]AOY77601.1 hypothetical protein BJL90_18105 [Clostridium formicaceticum]ARE88181.1 hypothetical protein CLFO_25820 [Clostridium formicaceticum]